MTRSPEGDLLDAALAALPDAPPVEKAPPEGSQRVAILGKPTVGKSSLLNRLAGGDRVVVDDVAGTTVDPTDELVGLDGRAWRFIEHRRDPQESQGSVAVAVTSHCHFHTSPRLTQRPARG